MRRLAWLMLPLLLATCRLPPRDGGDLAARLPEVQPGALATEADGSGAGPGEGLALEPFRPIMLVRTPARTLALGDGLSSFAGRDAAVRDVLELLFAGGGLDFVVAGDVRGDVSFDIRSTTKAEAFLELLRHVGLSMGVADGRVVISSRERRRFEVGELALPSDQLVAELRALLDPHGYGVRLPDGRLEVETTATAMEHVVAWLDGLAGAPAQALPFRVHSEAAPADEGGPRAITQGRLGRRELAEALAWRALTQALERRPVAAARRLEDALALEPDLPLAHLARGVARLLAGDVDGSRAPLERAAAARPDDRLAQTLVSLAALAGGRDASALASLETVHERWTDPRSATNLAGALQLGGRSDKALAVARTDAGPTPAALHLLRAWLFARADWVEAATAEVDAALALGLSVDDEGCALVLRLLDALQQGRSPFAGEPLADAPPEGAAQDEAPPSGPAGVRERFDSSWH